MAVKIQFRRDLAANWGSSTVLASGEVGYETDTGNIKIGDGTTQWGSLAYYQLPNVSVNPATTADLNNAAYRVMGRYRLNSVTSGSTFTNGPSDLDTADADSYCAMIVTSHAYTALSTLIQQTLTQFSGNGTTLKQWVRMYDGTNYTAWTSTAHISDGEITAAKIANDAVITAKIANNAVTADKLADDAATDANRAVTTNHIRDAAITSQKINNNAVTFAKLDAAVLPIGCIQMFGGSAAPSGWLLCNGQLVSRTTYAALFTAISTSFGAGDGSTTFAVPDLRNRFAVGAGTTGFSVALGGTGGTKDAIVVEHTHTATCSTDGAHTHTTNIGGGSSGGFPRGDGSPPTAVGTSSAGAHSHTITIANAGSSGTNQNLPPYLGMNYIIRAV